MGLREDLQKKIERKQTEIETLQRDFEYRIREANAYLQALQDTFKMIPKTGEQSSQEASLRHGSYVAQARDAITAAGKPLHITEILKALSLPNDKKQRLALSGSISAYVRQKKIFTRPSPNTFGLVYLDKLPEVSDEEIAEAMTATK
jgi:hypothetical protein